LRRVRTRGIGSPAGFYCWYC